MSEKEIAILISELGTTEVLCTYCKATGITIDRAKQQNFPDRCPCCDRPFSDTARNDMAWSQEFYQAVTDGETAFKFRVTLPTNQQQS
jgi:hypothetical protein